MINAGDACAELEGLMKLASRCCWIKVCHTSLYLHGQGYDQVLIDFVGSINMICAWMSVGNLLTCGIGSKISLNCSLSLASCQASTSALIIDVIWPLIAAM